MEKTRVSRKRRIHSEEFKHQAVARMANCGSVVGLAKELNVHWRLLYKWKTQLAAAAEAEQAAKNEQRLEQEIGRLKEALAEQVLQTRFFRGALQKIEARRQSGNAAGKRASTSKFVQ